LNDFLALRIAPIQRSLRVAPKNGIISGILVRPVWYVARARRFFVLLNLTELPGETDLGVGGEFDDRTIERTLASLGVLVGPRVGAGHADAAPEFGLPLAVSACSNVCVLATKCCTGNRPTRQAADFDALERDLYELYRLAN